MRNRIRALLVVLLVLPAAIAFHAVARGETADQLPVVDGKKVVATVGGEPIFWDEFQRALTLSHADVLTDPKRKMEGALTTGDIDFSQILERLVDVRLILREAGNMGLDALPEVKGAIEVNRRDTVAKMALERHVKTVGVLEEEVREAYRQRTRQWELRSALFKQKETAEDAAARIAEGADFDEEIEAAVAAGTASVDEQGRYLDRSEMNPAVASVVTEMTAGEVSPVIPFGFKGFVLFQVRDVRDPEDVDPEIWREVREQELKKKRGKTAREYYQELRERYAKVDKDLLDSLDYESEAPGIEALRKDSRILAKIKGEKPVAVSDLSEALEKKFFHGFARAAENKRVNNRKEEVFETMLEKKILFKEARRLGLDKTEEYRLRVKEFENAMIFGTFVEKVVAPDIRIHPDELQEYYTEHRDDFADPTMMRIQSLVFADRDRAFDAVEKLSAGTDFEWFSANADGLVAANTPGLLRFAGNLITERSLPEDVQKAVDGAQTGDYRLYSDQQKGYHYVLRMKQVIASRVRPLEAVTDEVIPALYQEKIKEALGEWTEQLSRHYPVEIYLTSPE